jgi:hypothetical protein
MPMVSVAGDLPAGQTRRVTNEELTRRYGDGEPLAALAEAAGMSVAGLQRRLRRIGVPPRRRPDRAAELNDQEINDALSRHGSISAAARSLGVGRAALTAHAQRLGILPSPAIPGDLAQRYQAGASIPDLAQRYETGTTTIVRWLEATGVPRRPRGRQPRDG